MSVRLLTKSLNGSKKKLPQFSTEFDPVIRSIWPSSSPNSGLQAGQVHRHERERYKSSLRYKAFARKVFIIRVVFIIIFFLSVVLSVLDHVVYMELNYGMWSAYFQIAWNPQKGSADGRKNRSYTNLVTGNRAQEVSIVFMMISITWSLAIVIFSSLRFSFFIQPIILCWWVHVGSTRWKTFKIFEDKNIQ